MATIYQFATRPRDLSRGDLGSVAQRSKPAEVIFFPGVRYERSVAAAAPKKSRGKRRRPRDEHASAT